MPPVEAWQKVFVDPVKFVENDIHAKSATCTQCHGGTDAAEMDAAHEGLVKNPTDGIELATTTCGACHKDITEAQVKSLHFTLHGYDTVISQRLGEAPESHAAWEEARANHCSSCHASCADCHVSQPASVGGGLVSGHQFKATQAFTKTCTGCHGSRINNEYTGRNEGVPADVHWTQEGMPCFKCHTGDEMHGITDDNKATRYDGSPSPACLDCHPDVAPGKGDIIQHNIHDGKLACQVCHSVENKSCYSCHVQQSDDGVPYYKTEPSVMDFKIGLNPLKSEERPWDYVVLRHVPVDPDSFAYYGDDVLANFDALPTWKYSTPHNIQRNTPQNASCDACHGNTDLFLSEADLKDYEIEANQSVIPTNLPPKTEQ